MIKKKNSPFDPNVREIAEILDGIPHGIAILDEQMRIVAMNRFLEGLTGYSCSDVRGLYIEFIIRSSLGVRGPIFHQVLSSGQATTVEGDIINRDRRRINIQFTISPIQNEIELTTGLVVVLEDISSLRTAMSTALFPENTTGLLGHSLKMQEVFELMPLMARTDASILITGETGTGKDKVAEAIHKASKRGRHPFIKINCGALPESLLESELFGHVKGAFTGAIKDKPGMFKLAQEGTIFLTEIGDMPLPLQVKLLSVLDDREFYPVGGDRKVTVDVRIIAATHRSLKEQVDLGNFREDLFYRLNVLHMHLPPLRERDGDVRFLLDHFLREYALSLSKKISGFTSRSIDVLTSYGYPGNIRELRNIVEYCANICQDERIRTEHLPKYLFAPIPVETPAIREVAPLVPVEGIAEPQISIARSGESDNTRDWTGIERKMIVDALMQTHGNRSKAARILGWGRTTLWRKMSQHNLT